MLAFGHAGCMVLFQHYQIDLWSLVSLLELVLLSAPVDVLVTSVTVAVAVLVLVLVVVVAVLVVVTR